MSTGSGELQIYVLAKLGPVMETLQKTSKYSSCTSDIIMWQMWAEIYMFW